MNKRFKCILFDLDGTLVSTGGAGIRALEKAFSSLYGRSKVMRRVNPAGKTDPAIIREIFDNEFQRDCSSEEMGVVERKYLSVLKEECDRSKNYRVMDGVTELLSYLEKTDVVIGLGTGNLEKGAEIKLMRADLNRFFAFGGFGSDAEDRAQLLRIGFEKAKRHSRRTLYPENTYVVGDTEKDVFAARKARFKAVAVGTGQTSYQSLKKLHPDFVLPDFKNRNEFIRILNQ